MNMATLHALIAAVCPIDGINSAGVIWFASGATTEQQTAGQEVMDTNLAQLGVIEPPLPIEQIRAIERTPAVADAMQRGSRLVALSYALDDLIRVAAAKGQTVTRTQAHAWAMVNDANYKTLYDAEQAIKPLRPLV
jgi:hypothetical protein